MAERPAKRPRLSNGSNSFAAQHQPHKPSARAKTGKGRLYTVSVALPGSILLNAQTDELRALLTSQIARTCAIFSVDEIIVFNEDLSNTELPRKRGTFRQTDDSEDLNAQMARLLEYLETPQYLRKKLFAMHPSLKHVGLLPPLDLPHHVRREDAIPYREGVIETWDSDALADKKGKRRATVDVGLAEPIALRAANVSTGLRVTVRMPFADKDARLVGAVEPLQKHGLYWGYRVRLASSISKIFVESPYRDEQDEANLGGYDLTLGTSERGIGFEEVQEGITKPFNHALVMLGGLSGLELSIAADPDLGLSAEDASDLFDFWVNVCSNQGSRTIRTEEALTITLSRLKPLFEAYGKMDA